MAFLVRRTIGIAGAVLLLTAVTAGLYATLSHAKSTSASQAGHPGLPGGVDFSQEGDANLAAAGGPLSTHLEAFASYAGNQIVSYGIEVDLVGPPTDAIRAVVLRDDPQYQGKPVPVRYRSVRHSWRELQALTDRIAADEADWQKQGIQLSSWGPEINSNTVRISLEHYTKAYRDALIGHYGNVVSVDPHDVVLVGD